MIEPSSSKLPRRERVAIATRRSLTLAREVQVLRRFVVCAGCGTRLQDRAAYDYDHEIALALGGRDEADNLRPYCRAVCHPEKTARDVRAIAKAKRLAGESGLKPSARPLPTRRDHVWPSRALPSRPLRWARPCQPAESAGLKSCPHSHGTTMGEKTPDDL